MTFQTIAQILCPVAMNATGSAMSGQPLPHRREDLLGQKVHLLEQMALRHYRPLDRHG